MVYVIRNPKDLIVSYYNYFKHWKYDMYNGTFDELFEMFISGKTSYGSWWEHVNGYANLENIHVIHYENLIEASEPPYIHFGIIFIQNTILAYIIHLLYLYSHYIIKEPVKTIKSLANYLGKNLNQVEIEQLVAFMKFDKMKAYFKMHQGEFIDGYEFLNNGRIGNWKKHLTQDMSRRIDDMVKIKLKYKFKGSIKYEPTKL